MLGDLGKHKESTKYLERAVSLREDLNKLDGDLVFAEGAPPIFDMLVPWMLW